MTGYSLVVLKPDCLARGLTAEAEAAIAAAGLTVRCRHRVTMTPERIGAFYADVPRHLHVLEARIFDLWMAAKDVELLVVAGADPRRAARRARDDVRARHSLGVFANLVHAPDGAGEAAVQLAALGQRACTSCRAAAAELHGDWPTCPDWPLLGDDAPAVLARIDELWHDPCSPFWEPGQVGPWPLAEGGGWQLVIEDSHDPLSLDNLAAATIAVLPEVPLAHLVDQLIDGAHGDAYPVARGTAADLAARAARLERFGAQARVAPAVAEPAGRPGRP